MHVLVGKRHRRARGERLRNIKARVAGALRRQTKSLFLRHLPEAGLGPIERYISRCSLSSQSGEIEMASLRKALLAGIAAIGIGVAGAASAQNVHVMTVPVPGGGVAQIRYIGEVPPQIVFVPAPAAHSIPGCRCRRYSARVRRSRCSTGSRPRWTGARRRCSAMPRQWPPAPLPAKSPRRHPGRCRRASAELFLCLDDFRQRRMHAERPDHVARRRTAAGRAAQLRQLRTQRPRRRRAGRRFSRRLRSLRRSRSSPT